MSCRESIKSSHRLIGEELEQMVIIEGSFMGGVSVVIQHPVVKDEFQFRPLNVTQKVLNASEKILWFGELLSC
jgi:hypothetical protein